MNTNDVTNLDFVRRLDTLGGNWASWEVEFSANGKDYSGILEAAIISPDDMHNDTITEVEEV